uniref:Secreted protein n=1 Tax=Thraustotheca clavata TaxID=74557 RepID=A0A0A7CLN6_9STRA|nr:secreted protein [Thraustotheca clavata]
MIAPTLVAIFFANAVHAHSWLECTNYDASSTSNQEYWSAAACTGYARCGSYQQSHGFGIDTGFDYRPLLHNKPCQCSKDSPNAYSASAPMATYVPGQKVCLAYPAKNHVAAPCTNQYIPDTGVRIFRTQHPASNLTGDDPALHSWPVEYKHLNGPHQNGVVDYKGFQHCPKFCEDKGRALCSMCFNLEKDIAPGVYTFQWEWDFNSANDVYTSCWEARVQN